jgi:hypothetical protein
VDASADNLAVGIRGFRTHNRVSIGMKHAKTPRILIVTPEVTHLPHHKGSISDCLSAKAGGLADVATFLLDRFDGYPDPFLTQ